MRWLHTWVSPRHASTDFIVHSRYQTQFKMKGLRSVTKAGKRDLQKRSTTL